MSWIPVPGAVPSIKNVRQKPKGNKAFPGTTVTLTVTQPYVKHAEFKKPTVLGVELPNEVPTGKTESRAIGPSVRSSADIHMSPKAVESMEENEDLFYKIMAKITGSPADLFFLMGHAIYEYGLGKAKNTKDGSLDIYVDVRAAKANGQIIAISGSDCAHLLQKM